MIFSTSSSPVPPRSFFAFFSALQQCLRWTLERRMRVDRAYLFAVLAAVFSFPLPCQKSVCEGREQRVKSFADICAEGRLAPAFSCPFLSCPCLPNGTQGISSKCSIPPPCKKGHRRVHVQRLIQSLARVQRRLAMDETIFTKKKIHLSSCDKNVSSQKIKT